MNCVARELGLAMRRLWRLRGFAGTTVAVIGLGIGSATFVFSVVRTMLLQSLPYERADALAVVTPPVSLAYWTVVEELETERSVFEEIGAYRLMAVNVSTQSHGERILAAEATSGFFAVTGVRAEIGRMFSPDEFRLGGERVVLLTDAFWHRYYSGAHDVVGRAATIDGTRYTIVGVLPPDFKTIGEMEPAHEISFDPTVGVVMPLAGRPSLFDSTRTDKFATGRGANIIVKIRKDVPIKRAQDVVARITSQTIPSPAPSFALLPLRRAVEGDLPRKLAIVSAAAGLLLLVACANEANLLLVRLHARRAEMAVRVALGARARHIVGTVLAETVLLGLGGAVAGVLTAWAGVFATRMIGASTVTRLDEVRINLPVLVFAGLVSGATTFLVTIIPALRTARVAVMPALHGNPSRAGLRSRLSVPTLLVGAQVAFSVVLVVGVLLLARDFGRSVSVPIGYRTQGILTAELSLDRFRYDRRTATAFFGELLARLRHLPGVDGAAVADIAPGADFAMMTMLQIGNEQPRGIEVRTVSEQYFTILSIPILAGRSFTDDDRADRDAVAVVNDALAERVADNPALAVGRQLSLSGRQHRIIGVVGSVRRSSSATPAVYISYRQARFSGATQMTALVRSRRGDDVSLARSLTSVVHTLDPTQPVYNVLTLQQIASARFARQRLMLAVVVAFAGITLALAALGIHGVMAYAAALRRREIAIRLAMGGTPRAIAGLMARRAVLVVAGGIAVSLPVVVAVGVFVQSEVFDFAGIDVVTCVAAVSVMVAAGLIASLSPVRQAVTIEPNVTLHAE